MCKLFKSRLIAKLRDLRKENTVLIESLKSSEAALLDSIRLCNVFEDSLTQEMSKTEKLKRELSWSKKNEENLKIQNREMQKHFQEKINLLTTGVKK